MEPRDMKDLFGEISQQAVQAKSVKHFPLDEGKNLIAVINDRGGYDVQDLTLLAPHHVPQGLVVNTLAGLVDYVLSDMENTDPKKVFIVVDGPSKIELVTVPEGPRNKRHTIIEARDTFGSPFDFDNWLSQEQFIIQLSTRIEESEDRADLLEIVSYLVAENDEMLEDNGMATKKMGTSGVKSTSGKTIPAVVRLKPFRTFRDIDQPMSPFILRIKQENGNVQLKLVEADGDKWKYDSVTGIKLFLSNAMPNIKVIG